MNLVIKFLFFFSLFHSSIINPADSKCPKSFECGHLGSLEFPLSNSPGCGLFTVYGCDSPNPTIQLEATGVAYRILRNIATNKLLVADDPLQQHLDNSSCFSFRNLSLPKSPSISFSVSPNLTLFVCVNETYSHEREYYFENYCRFNCSLLAVYYGFPTANAAPVPKGDRLPPDCSVIQLPLNSTNDRVSPENVFNLLTGEYILEWDISENCRECHRGGGQCLSDSVGQFECKRSGNRNILLIGGVTMASLASISIILFLFIRMTCVLLEKVKLVDQNKDIELFLKNNGDLAPKRYRYLDIKNMTKSFTENLGKGGYGSVYKGKLSDGRLVAVKMLNESKGNGEEFMNEVASISRTSHINVVNLLGFCFEGSKRALIYEFMPNGSLEKFIQNTGSSSVEVGLMGPETLFQIALGIARGLEYLHQGCNMRILHFDIKPHNILLDEDLHPKISDFGLAKLCPNRSSIVSMLVARGTIGYIAPEVFSRNFGEVSHKSDVYSYGMVILEIAGARKNIDPKDVDRSSEVYFPQYIYKQLEMEAETSGGNLDGIDVDEDETQFSMKKLKIVGLWCVQTDPKDRPSMKKVLKMLEGKLEVLQVPPTPYVSSPPRFAPNFQTLESL